MIFKGNRCIEDLQTPMPKEVLNRIPYLRRKLEAKEKIEKDAAEKARLEMEEEMKKKKDMIDYRSQ